MIFCRYPNTEVTKDDIRRNCEPCRTMVVLAPCTGVRCSELVALKWSDFDWQNLSVYIHRAVVSGRVNDVKTEYSEAPLPLEPALAEVIFELKKDTV
jgi:integrase